MTLVTLENAARRPASPRQTTRAFAARAVVACLWGLGLAAGGCAGDDGATEIASALGEPMGDFPGYEERVVLYATNRARVSPTVEGWPAYPAQPPFQWNVSLNQSSRAHSLDMRDTPCFQHPSCDGTDTFARVLTFYKGSWMSLAENISAGSADPQTTVHNWINELGAAPGETGHRDAIFSSSLTLIGVGFAPGGMAATTKLQNYWTQDFVGTTVKRPRLTDGIHFPKTAAAGGAVTFGATYYDAAVGAGTPQVFAVVDGACTALPLVRGTKGLGAYEGSVPLAAGCHPYYFVATLGDGVALATYPDTGALQVATGAAASSCALFATTRTTTTCGGAGGAGAGGGAAGSGAGGSSAGAGGSSAGAGGSSAGDAGAASGSAGASGAAGAAATGSGGAAGTSSPSGGAGGAPVSSATGAAGASPASGGSHGGSALGCSVAPASPASSLGGLLGLGALVACARRRASATSSLGRRSARRAAPSRA